MKTAVEFGAGGGSNAYYLKRHFDMVLSDLSKGMLQVSRQLNPDCKHIQGDMRSIQAGSTFDLVFIHDAITYITDTEDLLAVMKNAKKHLKENGILFIMTDQFQETFRPGTSHGGIDKARRGFRYLEWTDDSNPNDFVTETEYLYIIKNEKGEIFRESDSSRSGLFPMDTWEKLLASAGFRATFERIHYTAEPGIYYGIVAEQIPAG